ncbi:hypothetical protein PSP20601_05055 [Pandoraea sputorum]|nr:hypothetical protein PSP20601_05055 [Pandoraea sputorum]
MRSLKAGPAGRARRCPVRCMSGPRHGSGDLSGNGAHFRCSPDAGVRGTAPTMAARHASRLGTRSWGTRASPPRANAYVLASSDAPRPHTRAVGGHARRASLSAQPMWRFGIWRRLQNHATIVGRRLMDSPCIAPGKLARGEARGAGERGHDLRGIPGKPRLLYAPTLVALLPRAAASRCEWRDARQPGKQRGRADSGPAVLLMHARRPIRSLKLNFFLVSTCAGWFGHLDRTDMRHGTPSWVVVVAAAATAVRQG